MSIIYNKYQLLKKNSSQTDLFLFKSGAFYIFIGDDAKIVSDLLGLKLTSFNNIVQKCGFPINSIDKYIAKLQEANYNVQIIDSSNNTMYTVEEYSFDKTCKLIIDRLVNINVNEMTGVEALTLLNELQKISISIKGE